MSQIAVASTTSRINGKRSSVTYYEERDMEAYYITDAELAELCRLYAEQTISLADNELIDLIDGMGANGGVFM